MANQFKDLNDDVLKVIAPESPDQLVRDSAHGNLQTVKDILAKYPNVSIAIAALRSAHSVFTELLFLK